MSGGDPLPGLQTVAFLLYPHVAEEQTGVSSCKDTNPPWGGWVASILMTLYEPNLPPSTIHWGVGFTHEF